MARGVAYPRTCAVCGLGPCAKGYDSSWTIDNQVGKGPKVYDKEKEAATSKATPQHARYEVPPKCCTYNLTPDVPNRLVVVRWIDASHQQGPITRCELSDDLELVTVGLLIQETETRITLAMEYDPTDGQMREVQHIPLRYITHRQEFRIANPY